MTPIKSHDTRRHQSALLATTALASLFLVCVPGLVFAQNGIGSKYGSREPKTCSDTKAPAHGAIPSDVATRYVTCSQEGLTSDLLYLVENVKVSVGSSRAYNSFSDSYATSIDTTAPVYPIRGSFDKYQCSRSAPDNARRNCTLYREPKAEGKCYKTTFGDWYCNMQDLSNNESNIERNLPPPGGGMPATASATDKNQPVDIKKLGQPTAQSRPNTNSTKDENGFPPPDFSEMQKFFDVGRYEYDPTDRALYLTARMTRKNNAVDWVIDFYDADGIKVIDTNGISIVNGDYYKVGDIARYSFYLPPQAMWKRIDKVVVSKKVY